MCFQKDCHKVIVKADSEYKIVNNIITILLLFTTKKNEINNLNLNVVSKIVIG